MRDENDREYVRADSLPNWMASALEKIVPITIIAALGSGLLLWQQFAVIAARVDQLEQQANKGERFTAKDGARIEARVATMEAWRENHTAFSWEKTIDINTRMNGVEQKCRSICGGGE